MHARLTPSPFTSLPSPSLSFAFADKASSRHSFLCPFPLLSSPFLSLFLFRFVGNKINAGMYVLSPSVLNRVEMRPTSIEKEVFPYIAGDGKLFAMVLPGYWMDVGQPKDYLTGLHLYLDGLREKQSTQLATGDAFVGNVLVHETATIGAGCKIGPNVCIGPGCTVDDGVRLKNCMVFPSCKIGKHACVTGSIVGWSSKVGKWTRVENMSVLGEDVSCKDEVYVNGAVVLPHKEVKANELTPRIII